MLWLKVFHIVLVMSFFAGVFYLPRFFVNLSLLAKPSSNSTPEGNQAIADYLIIMARRLYRFTMILGGFALLTGVLLMWPNYLTSAWLHLKLLIVLMVFAYLGFCGRLLRQFSQHPLSAAVFQRSSRCTILVV